MKEKTLFKIALVCVVIGLIGLYYVSGRITAEEMDISKITSVDVEKDVKISGMVSKVENRGKVTIVEISQPNKIKVLLFDDIAVSEGSYVDVYGSVEEYEGEMEIIGNVIRFR